MGPRASKGAEQEAQDTEGPSSPRLTGFFMSRSSLSFCSSAAFLGMTSAWGSFLGLGGRTEEAAELAMTDPLFPWRVAAAARTYDYRAKSQRRKRSLPSGRGRGGIPSGKQAAEYS